MLTRRLPHGLLLTLSIFAITAGATACSSKSSTAPTPPAPKPALTVSSLNVTSSRTSGSFVYRVVVNMRETAGVAAPVSGIDLTFSNGTTVLATAHFDQVLPSTGNTCPASSSVASRELVTTDATTGHAAATSVTARVNYGDPAAASVANGTADVPPPGDGGGPTPTPTYTLTGTIRDQATGLAITGARVEAINGVNNGKNATTDASGNYTLSGLVAETFRMRASASGYDPGEQNVTIPANTIADMLLKQSASATCVYTISPSGTVDITKTGGSFAVTITRTSGVCGWQASTDANWIALGATSGNGDVTLTYIAAPNAAFVPRLGTITVTWSGGSASLSVRQAADSPPTCQYTVSSNAPATVPAAGGSYTALFSLAAGVPPGACGDFSATSTQLTISPPSTGPMPGSVNFTVPVNSTGAQRQLFLNVTVSGGSPAQLVITQSS